MGTTRHGDDPADGEPSLLLAAPRTVEVTTAKTIGELEAKLVDLWSRVNAAGGSVGFFGPSTAAEVRDGLAPHLSAVAAGRGSLCVLREPGTLRLLGFGFWELSSQPHTRHVAYLKRLMLQPDATGRNWGACWWPGCTPPDLATASRSAGLRFDTPTGPQLRDEVEVAIRLDGRPLFPLPSAGA